MTKHTFFWLTLLVVLSHCNKSAEPEFYQVSVFTSPENSGIIVPSQDTLLEDGSMYELEAIANEGFVFSGWAGDYETIDNPLTIAVESNTELEANFELKRYALNINVDGSGRVTETVVQTKTEYDHGSLVRIEAIPDSGWKFVGWEGDINSTDSIEQLIITEAKTVVANFERVSFKIGFIISGNGAVLEANGEEPKNEYQNGATVSFIAKADTTWIFENWGTQVSDTLTVSLVSDTTFTVNFREGILDACVPVNIDAYNIKSNNDSTLFLDWNIYYDDSFSFIKSYRKGLDFIKTGEWPLNFVEAELQYSSALISYVFLDYEGADQEIFYTWDNEVLTNLKTIHKQRNRTIEFDSDHIGYSPDCGINNIKGSTNDNSIYDLPYIYSNGCSTFEMPLDLRTLNFSTEKSIFYDVKGFPSMLGASYNHLIKESLPILLFNPNNARLLSEVTEIYNVDKRKYETQILTYDYFEFILGNDYPRYFTATLEDENNQHINLDTYKVKYYCSYK